jgi:trehalose 6-phosphate phosphatase
VLEELRPHIKAIAVISGRDRATLQALIPDGWIAVGSYGFEMPEELGPSPADLYPAASKVGSWPAMSDTEQSRLALDAARAELEQALASWPGVRLEAKSFGLAVHLRDATADADDVEPAVGAVAARHGLVIAPGRLVYELRPAGLPDKGDAVRRLVDALHPTVVVYAGDDRGDQPAFDALRALSDGVKTLAIGLSSAETPEQAMSACDVVLNNRGELSQLFVALLNTTLDGT